MPVVVPVKFPFASRALWFDPHGLDIEKGDYAICSTERGTEFGLVTADPFEVPRSQLIAPLKAIVRIATDEDLNRADALAARGEAAMSDFRQLINSNGLDMKPVGVEFLFGGEKTVFYFAAEDRVDFRQLIKDLCARFHERVDMRQIGVRDETRLIGGFAHCGQELCCSRFGRQFQPVSIRMAKEQDLPLNSAKISGMCGRLMCCLRYEFEAYKDFKSRAPKKKTLIDTPLGHARILEYDTPKEQLVLRLESGRVFRVDLSEMSCSEACIKHSEEARCPCRPDSVTREVLERIEAPEISLALLELDREMGVDVGDGLSNDDRIEGRSTGGRRSRRSGAAACGGSDDRSAHRRERRRSDRQAEDAARTPAGGRKRRRRASTTAPEARAGEPAGKAAAPVDGEQAPRQKQNRRRRRHSGQGSASDSGLTARTPGGVRADATPQGAQETPRRRHRGTSARKPETPSVADQLADGRFAVRRRPGDQGGSEPEGPQRRAQQTDRETKPPQRRRRRSRGPRRGAGGTDAPQDSRSEK
ncbi:PSP1 domain protein [Coriobacterium glomerans PW2]|uniref:PSP1 domain protein n=1 Tax=Coriobacterium glomerans (strain ATCC 49209 / DSM 20642 / JCM 10262 / PW2) TaxID=700015 RepID=F2N774_CORGP|nr:regulatory iron-sulfur-containing complex subunit RicT [Coriobacterium glomerans]AEB06549.1 PSP1 domain protein [Coriobacterium glomerans PW2]